MTNRQKAVNLLAYLTNQVGSESILEYIIFNWLDGNQAYQALLDAEQELLGDDFSDDFSDEEDDD